MGAPVQENHDFKVADLAVAKFGRKEIRLAGHEMPACRLYGRNSAPLSRCKARRSPVLCT